MAVKVTIKRSGAPAVSPESLERLTQSNFNQTEIMTMLVAGNR
jgi:hypothetical protein